MGMRRRGSWTGLLLLALIPALTLAPCDGHRSGAGGGGSRADVRARVVHVADGDTIKVRMPDGHTEDVRYIGVDTPETVDPDEPVQCYGEAASHFNDRLVSGRTALLRFDVERRDVYGRLLAYVYVGDRFVNAILARRGYARPLTIPPNRSHAPLFARLAGAAGRAGRGLWGACP